VAARLTTVLGHAPLRPAAGGRGLRAVRPATGTLLALPLRRTLPAPGGVHGRAPLPAVAAVSRRRNPGAAPRYPARHVSVTADSDKLATLGQ
jgi:hypothetical protein